jgi:uncharacterized protein
MNQGNQYVVPRVSIIETPPQPSATPSVSVGVIGLVGTFSKGAVNTPVTCYSLADVTRQFGAYTPGLTGFLSALGAFNQGASKVVIVRVGAASLKASALDLQDASGDHSVTVTALTPGTDGNNISVQVGAGSVAGTFKLSVSYKRTVVEIFDNLSLANLEVASQYVSLTADVGADAVPTAVADTPLAGGDDGATTADADYIGTVDPAGNRTGLQVLAAAYVNIVLCAQQSSTAVNQALIDHCKEAALSSGLRMAVLNAPKGVAPAQAAAAQTYSSSRALMAYPWVTPQEFPAVTAAPDGYYAGVLATLNPWVSPSNQPLQGVLATERALNEDDLVLLTRARICPVAFNNAMNDFRIANGINTFTYDPNSGSDDWSQIAIRREFDKIETEIWRKTQWAKSQPITKQLLQTLKTQIDEMLRNHRDETHEIYDFKPTICDETNNTPETMTARRVVTQISIRPDYAADFIDHNIGRFVG